MSGPPPHEEEALTRRRRRRRLILAGSGGLALLLIGVAIAGFSVLGHFNGNIRQDNITGMLGSRPADSHPRAENILVIGSDSRSGLSRAFGSGLVTDQSDTMMIVHVPADRKWAEVMSIPRDSWVNIPSCEESNGQRSQPQQSKINEAFALGNMNGNHTKLGVACTVKTLEQDTGIFINHFVVVNFTGLENMVAALGGVPECNPTPINDPLSGLHLTAGRHMLDPKQALGYVRARYTLGDGSDLQRIGRQQAFMSALVGRFHSELYNPVAVYRFLDAATRSLTIDSQLGGITGLYNLAQSLRNIPPGKIAFFTVPYYPRSDVVPSDTANLLWSQPEDSKIFASFREDIPASSALFRAKPPADRPEAAVSGARRAAGRGDAVIGARSRPAPDTTRGGPASRRPGNLPVHGRTANQSICAG